VTGFVRSTDVPEWLAEKVARVGHKRGCGAFDGGANRAVPAPKFEGSHRGHDIVWASIHIADLCNALGITPEDIVKLAGDRP
jgi:hypothetical protein